MEFFARAYTAYVKTYFWGYCFGKVYNFNARGFWDENFSANGFLHA